MSPKGTFLLKIERLCLPWLYCPIYTMYLKFAIIVDTLLLQDVVVYCLQSGDVDVNTKDNAGYTPLHECCVSGNREIARLLLSRGANVNCASQDGIRYLQQQKLVWEVFLKIFEAYIVLITKCQHVDFLRPIHDAVENDNVEMVRLLIVYGADPTLATYGGLSPEKIAHSDKMRSLITGNVAKCVY